MRTQKQLSEITHRLFYELFKESLYMEDRTVEKVNKLIKDTCIKYGVNEEKVRRIGGWRGDNTILHTERFKDNGLL